MPLPETIAVKYTEEEAEYLSLRPVVRQTFRIRELLDMILAVAGKDPARVQQILRSGTAVFHFYRYWWQGFEVTLDELAPLLATFPDPQPSRPFCAEECTAVELQPASGHHALLIEKKDAAQRNLLRRRSLWDCLLAAASATSAAGSAKHEDAAPASATPRVSPVAQPLLPVPSGAPRYAGYSYERKADCFLLPLAGASWPALQKGLVRTAPRRLRASLARLPTVTQAAYFCPRS